MTNFIVVDSGDRRDLVFLQNNDESVSFAIQDGPDPYDLTGLTLTFYLKASNTAPDSFSVNPTVPSAILGELTVTIARTHNATAGTFYYHIDAQTAGNLIGTLVYGYVTVIPV